MVASNRGRKGRCVKYRLRSTNDKSLLKSNTLSFYVCLFKLLLYKYCISFACETSQMMLCWGIVCFMVPQVGFEPTRPRAEDFESTKSTSSITVARYVSFFNEKRK